MDTRSPLTGTSNEYEIVQAVIRHMRRPAGAVDLCGKTSLGSIAALIRRSRLFIGNDTGTSHIAVAVGTPSIRIFTTSDPERWAPVDTARHPGVLRKEAMTDRVIRLAEQLLGKGE